MHRCQTNPCTVGDNRCQTMSVNKFPSFLGMLLWTHGGAVGAVSDKSSDARIHAFSKGSFRVAKRVAGKKGPELNDRKKIGDQDFPIPEKMLVLCCINNKNAHRTPIAPGIILRMPE